MREGGKKRALSSAPLKRKENDVHPALSTNHCALATILVLSLQCRKRNAVSTHRTRGKKKQKERKRALLTEEEPPAAVHLVQMTTAGLFSVSIENCVRRSHPPYIRHEANVGETTLEAMQGPQQNS